MPKAPSPQRGFWHVADQEIRIPPCTVTPLSSDHHKKGAPMQANMKSRPGTEVIIVGTHPDGMKVRFQVKPPSVDRRSSASSYFLQPLLSTPPFPLKVRYRLPLKGSA